MLNLLEKAYDKIKEVYGPKHFSALLILLIVISAVGFVIGIKYSKYIRKDPDYCNSCHLMQETYAQWRNSYHKTVTCQECHELGVIEQNSLLVKHIIYGSKNISQKHGKALPWENCEGCHWEQKTQGSGKPEEAYGHYRHHFVKCLNCHPFASHNFPFDSKACSKCHRGKEVHGAGMEGLACVNCHIFSAREGTEKNRVIPTRQRCLNCHKDSLKTSFSDSAPMASLECFECHKPHGAIKPDDALCIRCHMKDIGDKGHGLHKKSCSACHKAHLWKTEDNKRLCRACHAYRDPAGLFSKQ